jgi:hypothetical protein
MVYCPLCLSEFRPGFRTCSDCHAALVPTLENIESGGARLWKGDREEQLDRILGTLEEQNIPFRFHEVVNHPNYLRALGIPVGKGKPTMEYEMWIFRSDLARVRKAVAGVLHAASKGEER